MSLNEIFKSNHFHKAIIILAAAVILALAFTLGVFVGHEKARFSLAWRNNYYPNVMGPGGAGMMGALEFSQPQFSAHGGIGRIIKIEGNDLVIAGGDSVEKTVVVSDKTAIREFRQALTPADLSVDESVVVVGSPNEQGQIEARLIRVLPPAGGMMFLGPRRP